MASVGILIGIDDETKEPKVYKFDPAGWFTGNKVRITVRRLMSEVDGQAAVIGSKEVEAINQFEKLLHAKRFSRFYLLIFIDFFVFLFFFKFF